MTATKSHWQMILQAGVSSRLFPRIPQLPPDHRRRVRSHSGFTDETGKSQKYSLDADGKLVKRVKLKGTTPLLTEYRRDVLGRVTTVIDPLLNQWSYQYDQLGRRVDVVDPDLGTWNYAYDAASRLASQTDAKNQVTTLAYDALNRVTTKTVTALGQPTETTTNSYDNNISPRSAYNLGKLTTAKREVKQGTATLNSKTEEFDYDVAGRLIRDTHKMIGGQDRVLLTDYWPDGSLRKKTLADGTQTGDYSYDVAGRLTGFKDSAGTALISDVSYNARGQTTAISYAAGNITSAYSYNDARGFLARVLTTQSGLSKLDLNYTRNDKGLITGITSPQAANQWAYGYDALDRLITADNAVGTVDDRVYAYDDADYLIYNSGLCSDLNPNLIYPQQAALVGTPVNLTRSYQAQVVATQSSTYPGYFASFAIDNSAPKESDRSELEFSAVTSLAGRSGRHEGIEVHGRSEGVHFEAGR